MRAVWRASRAAMRRRRLQTIVIGLIVLAATATTVITLGLLDAASAPFEKAFAQQRGAHVVATFDVTQVSRARLAETAQRPDVDAAAGPFGQTVLQIRDDWLGRPPGPLTVVGRADPGGPVDQVDLLAGRWAAAPGEIVVNTPNGGRPALKLLGTRLDVDGTAPFTVVGFATSMSKSAGGWVTPEQLTTLRPTAWQMLYRLQAAGTDQQVSNGLASVTTGLPDGALTTAQSHLTLRRAFSSQADAYLPFMSVFGILGVLVSVLIVANVVSGAVVSGHRHIGVLKALGFTPNQVIAVYLAMVSVPALTGCVIGALLGTAVASPILQVAFSGIDTGVAAILLSAWVPVASLLGMPALVAAAALIPALRAHRLPAARAISAGNAQQSGRGLWIQRWLSGTRLPRLVRLGLGQPFARPGRAAMTVTAIGLGVATATLATGLTATMLAFSDANNAGGAARVGVQAGSPDNRRTPTGLSDAQIEALLRKLPGARDVTARTFLQVGLVGEPQPVYVDFYRGQPRTATSQVVNGHWPDGPGQVAAGPAFLVQRGLTVGDQITITVHGRQADLTIVGELVAGNARAMETTWETLATLAPATLPVEYTVTLAPGTDAHAYAEAVTVADPGLHPSVFGSGNATTTTVVGFATVFTALLIVVAALGVFNTVLLDTRERRRDLGVLKSLGTTPRQVVTMTVTSVAALGAVAGLLGLPLGIAAHRLLVDNVGIIAFPESMKDVWQVPHLVGLGLAGAAIAVLGALAPARSAARLPVGAMLHNE
ncbi:ABC transporter permease [Micromonospora echinaurantiaca]|uniref:ABC transporter permease n=1 Tax=Micromonospora echinaurantiaca TaxID=47857 RepID=UPI00341DC9FF